MSETWATGRVRAHVFVAGRVQGVFFRDSTRRHARALGLVGWVRNTDDDRVEVMLEGDESAVREAVAFLRKGPQFARVDNVDVTWSEPTGEFADFRVVGW